MSNTKQTQFWIPMVMAACVAIGLFLGNFLRPDTETFFTSNTNSRYQKMQDIIQILDQKYVDSVDSELLFEETISEMLHKLDPHSNYIAAADLKALNESIRGEFGGVGVRFFIIRDTVCITNVLQNSPAERAGVKSGDKVIEVDGEKVAGNGIDNQKIMKMLKGLEGTAVNLTLNRQGEEKKARVIRGSIPVVSVSAFNMMDKETGFIRIDQFSVNTYTEFMQAALVLREEGMKKLIIDLRNNGGGVLKGATDIADEFLPKGLSIVETKGVNSRPQKYLSTKKGAFEDVELVILINSNSASASEILAGAIQDNDRGTIVGRRSFGKGLVQEDIGLRDGSNLRLTIARYYTPTGRCIQKPYADNYNDYIHDQMERYENGELYAVDSTKLIDSLKYTTPNGKVVYGGGGIMPDVFIPLDTAGNSLYLTQLRYSAVFTTFAFDFVNGKRSNWSSPKIFAKEFDVDENVWSQFINFAETEYDIQPMLEFSKEEKALIKRFIKGEIARQIWVETGFYIVNNKVDKEVQQAKKAFDE